MENVIPVREQWTQPPLMWETHSEAKGKSPPARCSQFSGDTGQDVNALGSKFWPVAVVGEQVFPLQERPPARRRRLLPPTPPLPQNNVITVLYTETWVFVHTVQTTAKLSEGSGPRLSVKNLHPLDPVIPEPSGFSLTNVPGCPS